MSGAVKGLGLGFDEALHGISYANLLLMSASLPRYRSPDKGNRLSGSARATGEAINASDPRNRQRVRDFIAAID